jgi:hypothetical protein
MPCKLVSAEDGDVSAIDWVKILGPELGQVSRWEVNRTPLDPVGEVGRVFHATADVHKWEHYL